MNICSPTNNVEDLKLKGGKFAKTSQHLSLSKTQTYSWDIRLSPRVPSPGKGIYFFFFLNKNNFEQTKISIYNGTVIHFNLQLDGHTFIGAVILYLQWGRVPITEMLNCRWVLPFDFNIYMVRVWL